MSFLDNFSFAFQKISLIRDIFEEWIYGEKKKKWEYKKDFLWVIQKDKNFSEVNFDWNKHYVMTSKDFVLRCNNDVEPQKWDKIESFWNNYDVVFCEKVIVEWIHDHNLAIIRIIA